MRKLWRTISRVFGRRAVNKESWVPALGRPVTPEERVTLIEWLKRTDTALALAVAQSFRPTLFHPSTFSMTSPIDANRAQVHLATLQGWERCMVAIHSVGTPPRDRTDVQETFTQKPE